MNESRSASAPNRPLPHPADRRLHRLAIPILAMVAAFAAPLATTAAADLPEKGAYVEMVRGDRTRDGGDPVAAIENYGRALDLFRVLRAERPDYKSAAIEYRMDYCRRQIAALKAAAPATPAAAPVAAPAPAPVPVPVPAVAPSAPAEPAVDVAALREEIRRLTEGAASAEAMQARLKDVEAAAAQMETERKRLQDESGDLRRTADLAAKRVESMTAALAAVKQDLDAARKAGDVDAATAPLRDEIKRLGREAEAMGKDRDKAMAEAERANARHGEIEKALVDEKLAVKELKARVEALDPARAEGEMRTVLGDKARLEAQVQVLSAKLEAQTHEAKASRAAAEATQTDASRQVAALMRETRDLTREREQLVAKAGKSADRITSLEAQIAEASRPPQAAAPAAAPTPAPPPVAEAAPAAPVMPAPETPAPVPMPAPAPQPPPAWKADADAAMAANTADRALAIYEQALAASPDDPAALLGSSRAQLKLGNVEAARAAAARLVALQPDAASSQHALAMTEAAAKNRRSALRGFQKAVDLEPANPTYHRDLAVALYDRGRSADAAEHYREVVRLAPKDGQSHFNLAAILVMQRNPPLDEARAMYEKALALGEARDESIEKKLAAAP